VPVLGGIAEDLRILAKTSTALFAPGEAVYTYQTALFKKISPTLQHVDAWPALARKPIC